MRVKNGLGKILCISLLGAVALNCLFFSVSEAASDTHFSQRILPVRFVYLDKNGEVKKVWSNIGAQDDAYVVKFFSIDEKKEIKPELKQLDKYKEIIASSTFSGLKEGIIFESGKINATHIKRTESEIVFDVDVKFYKTSSAVEEIRTYV